MICQIWSGNRIIEGNVQGGSDFHLLQQHMYLVTLNPSLFGLNRNVVFRWFRTISRIIDPLLMCFIVRMSRQIA